MPILISTTWRGTEPTDLEAVLNAMSGLDIDGVELGSTHIWRPDFYKVVRAKSIGRILVHNYFPPAQNDLIINLASTDGTIRQRSLDHALACIRFCAEVGAEVYTIHPGFLAEPLIAQRNALDKSVYDFIYANEKSEKYQAFQYMIQSLNTLLEEAESANVNLAIETQGSKTTLGVSLLEDIADYRCLFSEIPKGLGINFNVAHTRFASSVHGYTMDAFIKEFGDRVVALELSHNDGEHDQHAPLKDGSFSLDWAAKFPKLPLILEFRNATLDDLKNSISLIRDSLATVSRNAEPNKDLQ